VRRLRLPDQAGLDREPGARQQLLDQLRPQAVRVEGETVVAVPCSICRTSSPTWKASNSRPPGTSTRASSANTSGNRAGGVWMIEYQASAPASDSSASSSASSEPTSNFSPGYACRATSTMPGERSTPNTSSPSDARYPAIRPGPHPRSPTGPVGPTSSANALSIARSQILSASKPSATSA
jgi:hypothetical protein